MKTNYKFNDLIEKKHHNNFFFIQVGAHDGITADPIHGYIKKYKWSGILIEPVEHLMKLLKQTYKNHSNLIYEQTAISTTKEEKIFYYFDEKWDTHFDTGLCSFSKEHILKHFRKGKRKPYIQKAIKELKSRKILCSRLDTIIIKHKIKTIDLLQIDTEGHDFKVIKSLDLNKLKPKVINYESRHLPNKEECELWLKSYGYTIEKYIKSDTTAWI